MRLAPLVLAAFALFAAPIGAETPGYTPQTFQAASDALQAILPPAPEGWTRTLTPDLASMMFKMGVAPVAEALYFKGEGQSMFTLNLSSDKAMAEGMATDYTDPAKLAAMGAVIRIGDLSLVDSSGYVTGLIAPQVILNASGQPADVMLPILQGLDLAALAAFKP